MDGTERQTLRSNICENKDLIDQRSELSDLRDQEIGLIADRLDSEGFL